MYSKDWRCIRNWLRDLSTFRQPWCLYRCYGPSQAVGFEGDVHKQEDAKRVVELTVKHFGKLDILVNAAAGNFLLSPEDLSPNGFRTVLDIDSVGTFTVCREALKYLKRRGSGRSSSSGGLLLMHLLEI
ncbi:hypothetical protein ACH5RR_027648 [Cinchona calisaya]|uniref:2,4-dienoyl-CoA reductase [(3E)-enoyl-CoA-producing] n=1 Tax=Cinchona calisaya TaxID=153742 RepID=A0ABD2YQY0_9GENT